MFVRLSNDLRVGLGQSFNLSEMTRLVLPHIHTAANPLKRPDTERRRASKLPLQQHLFFALHHNGEMRPDTVHCAKDHIRERRGSISSMERFLCRLLIDSAASSSTFVDRGLVAQSHSCHAGFLINLPALSL